MTDMPYTAEHKQATRERIIECARELFNRKGFAEVSIDEIMARAELTRGGFYNHFKTKEDLFVEAVEAYAHDNPADRWEDVELDFSQAAPVIAQQMINAYLSRTHLADIDGHCPMVALPSDVARASGKVRQAYQNLVERMVQVFAMGLQDNQAQSAREQALGLTAMCVGGMVLARTFEDAGFGDELIKATREMALQLVSWKQLDIVKPDLDAAANS